MTPSHGYCDSIRRQDFMKTGGIKGSMAYPKSNLVLKQFFSPGQNSVSDNGQADAERFYQCARPWGGQMSLFVPSKTASCGTRYDQAKFQQ
jgi:hypothetical protein